MEQEKNMTTKAWLLGKFGEPAQEIKIEEIHESESIIKAMQDTEISKCACCGLCKIKTNYVFGRGSYNPKVVFVGEAPGKEEDEQGKPFVGSAGIVLEALLEDEIQPEHYYITNILKCRPPNNRTPKLDEIAQCKGYIARELYALKPEYIVCLGNVAVRTIFEMFNCRSQIQSITKIHGDCFTGVEMASSRSVKLVPMYHPAVALYKPELRSVMLADVRRLANDIYYPDVEAFL